VGKTSLLARGLHQAREAGAQVILTDFQMLNACNLQSVEALLLALAESLATQLDGLPMPQPVWNQGSTPSINFELSPPAGAGPDRRARRLGAGRGGPALLV
jgi:hypothetical protein